MALSKVFSVEDIVELNEDCAKQKTALLVQFGSERCIRCPAFTETVAELAKTHSFHWAYADAHHPDCTLVEHFEIQKLPAFVLMIPGDESPLTVANATPDQVSQSVVRLCHPRLELDADF